MGLGHGADTVRDGLVLHLDAANVKSYPGTGTAWNDLSGNGNNGTMTSVSYESTNAGSLLFNDSNDSIIIPHAANLNFSSTFTVSTWIKVNSFNTNIFNVISKKPSYNSTQKGWSCQYDYRTTGVLQFRNNDGTSLNDHTPTSTVDNSALLNQTTLWANSAWVISNTNILFYINGIQKQNTTVVFTNTDTTTPIYIGKTVGSDGDPALLMNLSDIKIHNRALSASEIRQNFEAVRGRYGI